MSTEITTIALDLLIAGVATRLSVAEAFRYAEEFVRERDRRASATTRCAMQFVQDGRQYECMLPDGHDGDHRHPHARRPFDAVPPRDMPEAVDAARSQCSGLDDCLLFCAIHHPTPEERLAYSPPRPSVLHTRAPLWQRTDAGTWHRLAPGASEAECGESIDGETTTVEPRDLEHTCQDCRDSEPSTDYRAPPATDVLADATPPKPARPPRKPTDRRCCAPGCDVPGELAKNSHGARVARSAFLCIEHMPHADSAPADVRTWASKRREERALPVPKEASHGK